MSEFTNPRITKDGLDFDLWIKILPKCTFNQSFIKNGFIIRQQMGLKIKIKNLVTQQISKNISAKNPPKLPL